MRIVLAAATAFLALSFNAALAEDVPADPKSKVPPAYPTSCYPEDSVSAEQHRVDVAFEIGANGLTENVRIMQSTDACFEEVSLAAVRSWVYEPRRVNSRARRQEDMEATFIFDFILAEDPAGVDEPEVKTDARALVFDARPAKRVPPRFPDKCQSRAHREEIVVLEFSVDKNGDTKNVIVIDSTNDCFDRAARQSVRQWKYEPKTIDGEPVERNGVRVEIKFILEGAGRVRPENVIRRSVASRLNKARHRLQKKDDPVEVLQDLAEFEAKYGDGLSPAELAEFHRIRGLARLDAKDYQGALDDFYVVQREGSIEAAESVSVIVAELEKGLGVVNKELPGEDEN